MGNILYSTTKEEPEDLHSSVIVDSPNKEPEDLHIVEKSYADAIKLHDRGYPKLNMDEIITTINDKITILHKKKKDEMVVVVRQGKKARRRSRKFKPITRSKNAFAELTTIDEDDDEVLSIRDKPGSDEWNNIASSLTQIDTTDERVTKITYLGYKLSNLVADTDLCLVNVENTLPAITSFTGRILDVEFKLPVYKVAIYDITGDYKRRMFDDFHISSNVFTKTKVNGHTGEFMDDTFCHLTRMPDNWISTFKLPYRTVNFSSDKCWSLVDISGNFVKDHQYIVKYWNYNYANIQDGQCSLRYQF